MPKPQSVVSLDPISVNQKKNPGIIGRFLITKRFPGKPVARSDEFGHYLFCGKQRSGKTVSMTWFCEQLKKKYEKQGKKVFVYSNYGIGSPITRLKLFQLLNSIEFNKDVVHIIMLDEIHSWFPKDTKDKDILHHVDILTGEFSQLGKRQIYVLSTAQVYGRLNKNLREQCLYMVNCKLSFFNKCINEFIPGDDIMCDDLGRWSGIPKKIFKHGLPRASFDTHARVKFD